MTNDAKVTVETKKLDNAAIKEGVNTISFEAKENGVFTVKVNDNDLADSMESSDRNKIATGIKFEDLDTINVTGLNGKAKSLKIAS